MTTTINATNAGLVQDADSSGVLALQTNGTTAVSISTAQVVTLTNALPVASGGTGATSNAAAPFALKGANSDITQLSGLTTALSLAQGGTGATSSAAAPFALKGSNSDITQLSGLTTALSLAQGGTGQTTANAALNALLPSQTGNSGNYLTTNGTSTSWAAVSANYLARAWVNFNGTSTVSIRASGNVSSITDNGTGDYTVNFTAAVTDSNFAYLVTGGGATASANMCYMGSTVTSSSFRFGAYYPTYQAGGSIGSPAQDASTLCVSIFR